MKARALALVLVATALGGCSGGEGSRPPAPGPESRESGESRAIRGWIAALNEEDYGRAASFFAAPSVVQQPGSREVRLPDRAAAVAFNRSLPCDADVTDVEDEGATVLAAFRLRGRGCGGGSARVRFRFRDGKFAEWRQLAEPAAPEGEIARATATAQS